MTKTKEINIQLMYDLSHFTINVHVPDDFDTWTEEGQLKYLFTLRYLVDVNKRRIFNSDAIGIIEIVGNSNELF